MAQENLKIGEISKPRFEFRTFGQNFDDEHYRMARLPNAVPEKVWERSSQEIYILSRTNDKNNTKIRDGKMDIKTFVQEFHQSTQCCCLCVFRIVSFFFRSFSSNRFSSSISCSSACRAS